MTGPSRRVCPSVTSVDSGWRATHDARRKEGSKRGEEGWEMEGEWLATKTEDTEEHRTGVKRWLDGERGYRANEKQ